MSTNKGFVLLRSLLRAIRKLPEDRRQQARVECRFEFDRNRNASGAQLEQVLQKGKKSLEYVLLLTPPGASRRRGQAGKFVLRDGELVQVAEGSGSKNSAATGVRVEGITDEHMKRHHALLRRQHFMDGPLKGKY
jgi:hypothetical protein